MLAGFNVSGTTLAIDLTSAGTLAITTSGSGNYLFTLEGGDTFTGTDAAGITGDGLATLTVTSALDVSQVTVSNSVGDTAVRFADSAPDYVDSFTVNMAGIAGTGDWVPSVKFVGRSGFADAAALNVTAPTIAVEGATVSTEAGPLTLAGDTGKAFAGNFSGVTLTKSSAVSSDTGSVTLLGRGGSGATGNQNGVSIGSGSSVTAGTGTPANPVTLRIAGIGGTVAGGGNASHGIVLETGGAISAIGPIQLEGKGGPSNSGNRGVLLSGTVNATDPGGTISIDGTGGGTAGDTAADNHGVFVGNQALVSADGLILVNAKTGPGKSSTTSPYSTSSGLYLNSAHVSSSGGDIVFNSDSFRLQGTGTAIAGNRTVSYVNRTDGQVMLLDRPVNNVLSRTYAKAITFGSKTAVIEQEVAAGGGAVNVGTADLSLAGSAIRLRSDVKSGGALSLDGPVILGTPTAIGPAAPAVAGDVRLTGNGVTLAGTVDGAKNLTIVSGTSPIALAQAVGKTTPLASLRVESASAVKASSTLAIDGSAAGAAKNGLSFAAGVNGIDMRSPGSTIANAAGHGIVLGSTSGSTLAGFTVKSPGISGIRASGAMPSTTVSSISITGAPVGTGGGRTTPYGAFLSDTPGLTFGTGSAGNTITGVSTGIVATGDMQSASLRSNVVRGNDAGVYLMAPRGLQVAGNTIADNPFYGVRAEGTATGTTLRSNTISASNYGVLLDNAKGVQVGAAGANNAIQAGIDATGKAYDAGRTSVGVHATGDLTGTKIVSNSIVDNTIGVRLADARGLAMSGGNLLFRNRFQGIVATGTCTSSTIRGTTVEGSLPGGAQAPFGIHLTSASGLVVGGDADADANGVYGTGTAVWAGGALTGSAVKRTIVRNMTNGFVLNNAQGLWVQSNDFHGAVQQGLNASGNLTGTTVLFNRMVSGAQGVVLDAAKAIDVKNNVVESNRVVGLFATGDCSGTKVSANAIVRNGVNISTSTATGGSFQTS